MSKKYALLYQLEIAHAYYADGVSKDFIIQPSPATQKLMGKLDLHLVASDTGVKIFWGLEERGSEKVSPFLLLDAPLVMIFLLIPQHPTFFNYTELEIPGDSSEVYYYQNELSGSEQTELIGTSVRFAELIQEVTYTPPADATLAVNATLSQVGGAKLFTDTISQEDSQTGSYRVALDAEDDWGKYLLELESTEKGQTLQRADLYLLSNSVNAKTWGLLQLIVPPYNAGFPPPEQAASGKISFLPRATTWRYLLVNQSQFNFDELRLIRNGEIITDTPPTKQKALPNGQEATVLTLPTPLPLLQNNPEKIEVELLDTQGGSAPPKSVYKIQLPLPDAQRIYPEREDGGIKIYSDLFVYL